MRPIVSRCGDGGVVDEGEIAAENGGDSDSQAGAGKADRPSYSVTVGKCECSHAMRGCYVDQLIGMRCAVT